MITIYTIAFNEELMLPFFIRHYRTMFPDCHIVVYDNESTDRTVDIAKENNCEVIVYKTDGKLSDKAYLEIKNNCWKEAKTSWVLIADVDEHCFITEQQLKDESDNGVSVIRFHGFNMVNHDELLVVRGFDVNHIIYGVRSISYDKTYLFDKDLIDIAYNPGAHTANIRGHVVYGKNIYTCRHYKYVDVDYMVKRHAIFASRLSDDNIKFGYGGHYKQTSEEIRNEFEQAKKESYVIK